MSPTYQTFVWYVKNFVSGRTQDSGLRTQNSADLGSDESRENEADQQPTGDVENRRSNP